MRNGTFLPENARHGGIDAIAHMRLHLYWMSDLR